MVFLSRMRRLRPLALAAVMAFTALPAAAQRWSDAMLTELAAAADTAPAHGLPYEFARLERIKALRARLSGTRPREAQAIRYEIDAEASALFRRLALDFAAGRIAPRSVDIGWYILPQEPDTEGLEAAALEMNTVAATLWGLLPRHAEYRALFEAYGELLRLPGGNGNANDGDNEGDGGTGPTDYSRAEKLAKLRATLERWRWMPRELPKRRIEVHVPEYHVVIATNGTVGHTYRAVVGTQYLRTPSFITSATGIIINPRWVPPSSIVRKELIPKFRKDPAAAARGGYVIFSAKGERLDPAHIDWSVHAPSLRIIQQPGPGNALGRIKLDMPNRHAVFLHDTPAQSLFDRPARAFSHGCIRVENARDFAADVLASPQWERARIDTLVDVGETTLVPLAEPVSVFVIYITANRLENGPITYADDLYGRDASLMAALERADAEASGARQRASPPAKD